jgi:hypothetical protein
MKKAIFAILVLFVLFGCSSQQATVVNGNEKVLPDAAPAANDNSGGEPKMDLDEAVLIAMDSECTEEGILGADAFYNSNSDTWWIDLELEKEGCSPACVVDANTEEAEINWRCTGLN